MIKILSKVKLLNALRFDQLQLLRDRMGTRSFTQGEYIVTEGESGSMFYVIVRGSAVVRKLQTRTNLDTGIEEQACISHTDTTIVLASASVAELMPRCAHVLVRRLRWISQHYQSSWRLERLL